MRLQNDLNKLVEVGRRKVELAVGTVDAEPVGASRPSI